MTLKQKIKSALLDKFMNEKGAINFSSSAKAIKVSRQTIMGWANGKVDVYEIKLINLIKLSEATGKPVSWFLETKGKNYAVNDKGPEYNVYERLGKEARKLVDEIQKEAISEHLTIEAIEILTQLVRQLAKITNNKA